MNRSAICLVLLLGVQTTFAEHNPKCRGIWIEANPNLAGLSNSGVLEEAKKHYTVEVVEPRRGRIPKVVLVGGHSDESEVLNELLIRYPVRLVGFKALHRFSQLRERWLSGLSPEEETRKSGLLERFKNGWDARRTSSKIAHYRTLDSLLESSSAAAKAVVGHVRSSGREEHLAVLAGFPEEIIRRHKWAGVKAFSAGAVLFTELAVLPYFLGPLTLSHGIGYFISTAVGAILIKDGFQERRRAATQYIDDRELLAERITQFNLKSEATVQNFLRTEDRDVQLGLLSNPPDVDDFSELLVVVDNAEIVSYLKQELEKPPFSFLVPPKRP